MTRVAWWTCALLAASLAHARVYNSCELARELQELGVHPDRVSTWVCIAYHESRYDTAANNPSSGDHGIFQISELYWCGPGKACGLPCSALRDEDISDDLECALQVHEEHTRLQGDGFLAWVVYPHHCKHNTKKYLANCDSSPKNHSAPTSAARSFALNIDQYRSNANIDNLLPPYLAISSIFRGSYGKVLDHNMINGVDWYNYKYDKVDELKLPDFTSEAHKGAYTPEPAPPTTLRSTTTTTTSTAYVPRVKVWRVIETNQFRKKSLPLDKTTSKPTTPEKSNVAFDRYSTSPSTEKPPTESTTRRSRTTSTVADVSPKVRSTLTSYKSPTMRTTLAPTTKPVNITNTVYKSTTFPTSYSTTTTTNRPSTESSVAYTRASYGSYRFQSRTTNKPSTIPPFIFTNAPTTKTVSTKSSSNSVFSSFPLASFISFGTRTTTTTTTTKPSTTTTVKPTTSRPTTKYQPYTYITRGSSRVFFTNNSETTRPFTSTSRLPASQSTTTVRPTTTTRRTTERTSRATQNIFDLYLNPTKPPPPTFTFPSRSNSRFKFNIFAGGTTTHGPSYRNDEDFKRERNQIRRQT